MELNKYQKEKITLTDILNISYSSKNKEVNYAEATYMNELKTMNKQLNNSMASNEFLPDTLAPKDEEVVNAQTNTNKLKAASN